MGIVETRGDEEERKREKQGEYNRDFTPDFFQL